MLWRCAAKLLSPNRYVKQRRRVIAATRMHINHTHRVDFAIMLCHQIHRRHLSLRSIVVKIQSMSSSVAWKTQSSNWWRKSRPMFPWSWHLKMRSTFNQRLAVIYARKSWAQTVLVSRTSTATGIRLGLGWNRILCSIIFRLKRTLDRSRKI